MELTMEYTLYWLDTTYACGGLLVQPENRRIVGAPPIYRKYLGLSLDTVIARLQRRGWLRYIKEVRNG
jgi:hypothetical protein